MEKYQKRVIQEQKDLDEKLNRLTGFIDSSASNELSDIDILLLIDQAAAMRDYLNILNSRIKGFGD